MAPEGERIRAYDAARDFEGMFLVAREIVSLPPFDEARRELLEYPGKRVFAHVAEVPGEGVVGFAAASFPYWNQVGIIDYLVVAPPHRRKRIGERLVRAIERDLAAASARLVAVTTASWNEDGLRFYRRIGYGERMRLSGYLLDDRDDLVWLDRALGT